jgi:hypothetical protein
MVRGEQPEQEPVKVKKTLSELYEDFLEAASNDRNWTKNSFYKYG